MKATLSKLSLDPVKLEEIFEYVSAIAGMSGYISLENVIYHAQLAEDPHAYTWKEYGELVSSWNEDPSVLRATLELRAEEKHLTIERVVQECFKAACEQYDKFLSRAADDDLEASFKTKLEGAKKEARFLRALAFELGYFGGVNPVLSVEHYVLLMKSFAKWAHFNNHAEYPAMRSAEKQLLLDVVGHLAQPERLYEEVRPWAIDSYVRKEAENALYTAVGDLLAPRVATRALELFERSGGIHSIWPRDEHYGVRRILFDPKGQVLGVKANRDVLLDIFKRAPENAVIAQNSLEFFHMLGAALKGKFDFQAEELEQLKKDHEFILAIWNAATSFPIQPRALGSLMESGDEVKASAGIIELPKKEWMSVNSPDDKAIITPSPKPDVVEATDA
jgi:hypothetical protein